MPSKSSAKKTSAKTKSKTPVAKSKVSRKKTIVKKISRTKKKPTKPNIKNIQISEPKDHEFIPINSHDPEIENKNRLLWIIVAIIAVGLIGFWFWSLKKNIVETINNYQNSPELADKVNELKNTFDATKQIIGNADKNITTQKDLTLLKQQIIKDIENNITKQSWPQHSSEILGLSIQYPLGWQKIETNGKIVLNSYDNTLTTTTPIIFARIIIEANDLASTTPQLAAQTIVNSHPDKYSLSPEQYKINGQTAQKIIETNINSQSLSEILIAASKNKLYKITIQSPGGKDLYRQILDEIISTISFID